MKKNKVPESFPGSLMITLEDGPMKYLHPDYRSYENDEWEAEFEYFMSRIMSAIAPSRNQYNKNCGRLQLSTIYTISDKAFGLLILYNKLHCWDEALEFESNSKEKRPIKTTSRKRFCDSTTGRKQGWSEDGRNLYAHLCWAIKNRREQISSIDIEKKFMKKHSHATTRNNEDNSNRIPTVDYWSDDQSSDDE